MNWLWWIPAGLMSFFLTYPFWMTLLASGRRFKFKTRRESYFDIACIITAYKDLEICAPLLDALFQQEHANIQIYLVADQCKKPNTSWWNRLHHPKMTFLAPTKALGSKVASMIYAKERFIRDHEAVIIFDPDNIPARDFVFKMDELLRSGFVAGQGRRAAKNSDTQIAQADANGELYKNWIEREVPTRLGSSATIAGSAMIIERQLFEDYLQSDRIQKPLQAGEVIPAEDKILQNFIIGRSKRIPFRWDAICYDEKVEDASQVQRQRTRWTYAWFENLPYALGLFLKSFFRFSWNGICFSIYSLIPPLFILLGSSGILMLLLFFLSPLAGLLVAASLLIFVLHIFWALQLAGAGDSLRSKLLGMPVFALNQIASLLRIRGAKKDFLVTEKRKKVSLEELEGKEKESSN
jgi:cellulose synthase/poly-beta-1,6-N-acetylglucosamine synthase-like glycosyltransferase